MDFGKEKLQCLKEAEKICWVFGNYAASTVAALCCALRSINGAMTESRRGQILGQMSGLSPSDATALGRLIECECVSLVGPFAPRSNVPSTSTSGEYLLRVWGNAGSQSQVQSEVLHKCWSNSDKVTLRCTTCSLFYNYAQYGNKRVCGFHHYPAERPAVEASDTTYLSTQM